ncbi:MAG: NAD-dependent epimerase/dehydratase family protein [Promethearchaeota archaeon]
MKVLLTGAFGNVGSSTLEELIKIGHQVRCFDIKTSINKKRARKFRKKVEIFWGDLRNIEDVEGAVVGVDVVIHLAAIIPPLANQNPEFAETVNVGGTRNIINAMEKLPNPPKLIYTSSVAVYGDIRHKESPIIKTTDPFNPSPHDEYARQKIKCEELIKNSELIWVIFRLAAIPPLDIKLDPLMFEVPLDTPIEFAHTKDTGLAIAKAASNKEIWGKIFHLAGGEQCRIPYKEYVGKMLEAMGIGRLPEEAYSDAPFHCGYMETKESQRLLQYQRHTFDDLLEETKKRAPMKRLLAILFRPLVRSYLLGKSPHYQTYKRSLRKTPVEPKPVKT